MTKLLLMAEPPTNAGVGSNGKMGAFAPGVRRGYLGPTRMAGVGQPTILLSIGRQPAAVAQQVARERAAWLPSEAPLWLVEVGLGEEASRTMGIVRTRLLRVLAEVVASQAGQRRAGSELSAHADAQLPQVWLLLSAGAIQGHGVGGGEQEGDDLALVSEQVEQLWRLLEVVGLQQLRVAIVPQVLVLATAADEPRVERWRELLGALGLEALYVIKVADNALGEGGLVAAAQSVCALCWLRQAVATSGGEAQSRALPVTYTVGAALWPIPDEQVRRALAVMLATKTVETLVAVYGSAALDAVAGSPPKLSTTAPTTPLARTVAQLVRAGETVRSSVPRPAPVRVGRGRARWWRSALRPTAVLQTYCRLDLREQRLRQRQARQQWLARQWPLWVAVWQQFTQGALTVAAWADGAQAGAAAQQDQATLRAVRVLVWEQAQAVDQWLMSLAATHARGEAKVQQLCRDLEVYCATLPPRALYGVWVVLKTPWRWPQWVWQLGVGLPWRLRQLEQALTARELASYEEANVQIVRQLALAMLHDVQLQVTQLATIQQRLVAAAAYLVDEQKAALAALPAPWHAARLAEVGRRLGEQGDLVEIPPFALSDWLDGQGEESSIAHDEATAARLGEELIAWCGQRAAPLESWPAEEWLRTTFGWPAVKNGGKGEAKAAQPAVSFATWLAALAHKAMPAGRASGEGATLPVERWLVVPRSANGAMGGDDDPPWDIDEGAPYGWLRRLAQGLTVVEGDVQGVWLVVWKEGG